MDFSCSKVGTLEYWENNYKEDLENLQSAGYQQDTWFGQKSIDRLLNWIRRNRDKETVIHNSAILDIGAGNGALLFALEREGFENLLGIDYSQSAVKLGEAISHKENSHVTFKVLDFLSEEELLQNFKPEQFELCLDKGTYDAIALCPEDSEAKLHQYRKSLQLVCRQFFIITSCNFTKDELVKVFSTDGFELVEEIPTPSFQFGGRSGNKEAVLVFRTNSHLGHFT